MIRSAELADAPLPVLALAGVALRRGRMDVLSGLSLEVGPGETVALVGPSGSGKTSVLRLLLGFEVPGRGEVRVGGALASKDGRIVIPPERRGLSIVFQDLALWPHLSVAQNLAFVLEARGAPRAERAHRTSSMLERVGLSAMAERRPGELSGGERQRVAIARALVGRPRAVLLDEPLANLDVVGKRELLDLVVALLAEHEASAIYVTHDPLEAARVASRVAVLEAGRIVQAASPHELVARPASPFVAAFASGMAAS